jgi:hypothetical protein
MRQGPLQESEKKRARAQKRTLVSEKIPVEETSFALSNFIPMEVRLKFKLAVFIYLSHVYG